jgi:hypothetical protein
MARKPKFNHRVSIALDLVPIVPGAFVDLIGQVITKRARGIVLHLHAHASLKYAKHAGVVVGEKRSGLANGKVVA